MNNLLSQKILLGLQVTLEGLPPGEYRVSRYLMDRDNGSMYRSWVKLDYTLAMYDDMVQILKQTAAPAVTIRSRKLKKELLLETTLSTNAVEVYLISKMNVRVFCNSHSMSYLKLTGVYLQETKKPIQLKYLCNFRQKNFVEHYIV